jgi:hypothetical protein
LAGSRTSHQRRRSVPPSRGVGGPGVRDSAPADSSQYPIPTVERRSHSTWTATVTRVLLGFVFAWFGYHELVNPRLWTGYVPVVPATSTVSVILVLAHGLLLCVLAVALTVGVAPRVAGAIGALLMVEIVVSLGVTGINDIVVRDLGVLGLAVGVAVGQSRGVLTR